MRKLMLIVLLLLAGCRWGVLELQGWDAVAREQSAREVHAAAEKIEEAVAEAPQEVKDAVAPLVEKIKERAGDEARRADIALQESGCPPKEEVVLGSEKDEQMVQARAGLAYAKSVRREKLAAFPGRLARGVASVAAGMVSELTPRPIKIALKVAVYVLVGYAVIATIVTVSLWLGRRFWRKSTKEAIDRFDRLPEEERKRLTASAHYLGLAFEKERK